MSALPEALPLAIAAGIYPPALLVLLLLLMNGKHPRTLVLAYYGGAAILTTGAGLAGLAILEGAGLTAKGSQTASGWTYIGIGLLLLTFAADRWVSTDCRCVRDHRRHQRARLSVGLVARAGRD